ncbi:MAG: methionine--tRNA ligase [Thermoguttaceae bacterium]
MKRRILATSGLPYANGHIHIGHLVEYLQTDIWVRFQKMCGNEALYICGDDTHGTTIMLRARSEGRTEEEVIQSMHTAHLNDFTGFGIHFDYYGSTNAPENRQICHEIWNEIKKAGMLQEKEIEQLFDTTANTFLADRFVKGTCPVCCKRDQYGDNCECGAHYSPTELADPISTISGTVPELRKAKHLFVDIEARHDFLDSWVRSGSLQSEIENFLLGQFLHKPLLAWDISRPSPYFGFEIPDFPGNYWYVWFDAPVGYIAATMQWAKQNGENFDKWWKNPETEIHHFIGKDITYFHTLFWPTMLQIASFTLPKKIHVHGFLTVDGEKMSKSRGTFILASTYLKHLDPSYLRYFYASKLSNRVDDIDLNFDEMETKINADLIGNVVNLVSRTAKFAHQTGLSAQYPDDGGLFAQAASASNEIAEAYQSCELGKAMKLIMECGHRANKFIEDAAPWTLKNDPNRQDELRDICTIGLNLFRQIVVYLAPVLPELRKQTEKLLGDQLAHWESAQNPLLGSKVNEYQHFMQRVSKSAIAQIIEESKQVNSSNIATNKQVAMTSEDTNESILAEPLLTEKISIDDFTKVDLRIARIVEASEVPDARKLLQLKLSLGGDEYRQVFAGIKVAYKPEELIGRLVVCVANLQPRQMKFGLSEGMVVAAGPGGSDIFLLSPDDGAKPGMRLH